VAEDVRRPLSNRVIEPVNYVLQKSLRAKPFVVHADKLKKCYGVTPDSWLSSDAEPAIDNEGFGILPTPLPEVNTLETTTISPPRGHKRHRSRAQVPITANEPQNVNQNIRQARPRCEHRRLPTFLCDYYH